ncbi:MAG: tRNA threonylcarbamoyladenosine dehydratase [Victivallaceae bacterium]|nr:tRNA threonylcarbamoyladenosine dehydratase [Victivallaceae bacterium]MDD3116143.1 tRNA threonylcarbamoyladenosine dehydratase [Victivallaceae bacterium]MDD3702615.1 tRNA threonylcarbamoyladenosine dehydratase [Victivallaceae bacterium]MDD4317672.1 tRNA threonylcarbamoyladenosine dehydratase [Victivallaceae bacterium]MDD5663044.1 tRNA threonylcarbamoyladenosine dehydratase [Victivallaceae bacterium]
MSNEKYITPEWQERTTLLLGERKMARLRDAHVLAVGLGGVGAYAVEMLCRAGVGKITIADGDVVEDSNRNRQLPALISSVGRLKGEVIAERLCDINPEIKLTVINEFIRDEKTDRLLNASGYDCVLDAIDSLSPKFNLISKALRLDLKVVSALGAGGRLDPSKVCCTDISKSYNCNLGRALRKRLHRNGIYDGFKVVFSPEDVPEEAIIADDNGDGKFRSTVGTISYMPAVFGCFCAAAVIDEIISKEGV